MVVRNRTEQKANRLFHALANVTRRDIVRCAMVGEHSVSSLARRYPMSFAAVQKHVAVLEKAGLVTKSRRGREHLVCTNVAALRQASALLDQLESVWRGRIERMAATLDDSTPGGPQ